MCLQDAVVGRRLAALVVLGLQAVDRDDDLEARQRAHSIGIGRTALVTSCVWMPRCGEHRQQRVQLAEADQRLAADDREVERLVLVDQAQHCACTSASPL